MFQKYLNPTKNNLNFKICSIELFAFGRFANVSVERKKGAVSLLKNVQKVAWVYKTEKSLWLESVISERVLKK